MTQVPLLFSMYLVGLLATLAFGPSQHRGLCYAIAFPIGLAIVVLSTLFVLALHIPLNPWTYGLLLLLASGVSLGRLGWPIDRVTVAWGLASCAAFIFVAALLSYWNMSLMSFDSHHMVMLGNVIADDGALETRTLAELQAWGGFSVIAQSLKAFTMQDYFYSLQPVMGASFFLSFSVILAYATREMGSRLHRHVAIALVGISLFSIYAFAFHFVFIHTNLGTALYLFLYVTMFWIAERENDPRWLPIAFLCLIALSFQRVEAPLVALTTLGVTVMPSRLPRRWLTPGVLVFSALVVAWYVLLAFHVSPKGAFLTPKRCILVALGVTSFLGLWLLVGKSSLQKFRQHIPRLLGVALVLVLAASFVFKFEHMIVSARTWLHNLYGLPHWGYAWYAIALALALSVFTPPVDRGEMFTRTILYALACILALVVLRAPYRHAMLDSANRMTIHVLPLLFFYVGMRAIPAALGFHTQASSPSTE